MITTFTARVENREKWRENHDHLVLLLFFAVRVFRKSDAKSLKCLVFACETLLFSYFRLTAATVQEQRQRRPSCVIYFLTIFTSIHRSSGRGKFVGY